MRQFAKQQLLKKSYSSNNHLVLLKVILYPLVIFLVFFAILALIQLRTYASQVPTKDKIAETLSDRGQNSTILDRNGNVLYVFKDPVRDREYANFNELPPTVIAAVLAAEDKNFFAHRGIDYFGAAKGAFTTISSGGENTVGGSTITQQLVKQTLLTNERTLDRKAKEAIIALMVEQSYSKEEILEFYLNTTSYGGRVTGIKTAARTYFNKTLDQVNLNEAAFLVGLVQSPGEYSPLFANNTARAAQLADNRRKYVLGQIIENSQLKAYLNTGNINILKDGVVYASENLNELATSSEDSADTSYKYNNQFLDALSEKRVKVTSTEDFIRAPHWVFYVRDVLKQSPYNLSTNELYSGGYTIRTTLDLKMNDIAKRRVYQGVEGLGVRYGFHNAALVTVDSNTGEILAMIGSKGYDLPAEGDKFDPEVNVTTSLQSLGSSLKPWVVYLAFDRLPAKYNPSTIVADTPQSFDTPEGPYEPKNYDSGFNGEMTLATALLQSRNLPFLKISDDIGSWQLPQMMTQIGYRDSNPYGLAATIGGVDESLLDHTAAYTGMSTGYKVVSEQAILEITDAEGNQIYKFSKPNQLVNLNPGATAQVNAILGTQSYPWGLRSYKLAGKTGTSDQNKDVYYVGYTPRLVTGIWAGNNDNSPMFGNAYGSSVAKPIWEGYMEEILQKYPQFVEWGSY